MLVRDMLLNLLKLQLQRHVRANVHLWIMRSDLGLGVTASATRTPHPDERRIAVEVSVRPGERAKLLIWMVSVLALLRFPWLAVWLVNGTALPASVTDRGTTAACASSQAAQTTTASAAASPTRASLTNALASVLMPLVAIPASGCDIARPLAAGRRRIRGPRQGRGRVAPH